MVFKFFLISALLLILAYSFFILSSKDSYSKLKKIKDREQVEIILDDQELKVEVVNQPDSRLQGLSNRQELGADGMLFVLDQRRVPYFWMKQMRFNLDIVWIVDDRVVDITWEAKAPKPNDSLEDLPYYYPNQPVEMVLEVKAGQIEVEVGDKLRLADK